MNKNAVTDRLIRFEGSVPWMYRCTGGEVTVGVGHAIQSVDDALALEWDAEDPARIEEDYARVATSPMGKYYAASYYEDLTTSRMADAEIEDLCALDIGRFEDELKRALPFWDTYHELAQQALFDMGFNLGIAGLMKFPKMLAAVDDGDWETAAAESHRNGIPDDRNQEIADLYRSCEGDV